MDIDKLTKLVKLANHNPNDHEANSAARRVCKMIEDANFEFVDSLGNTIKEDPRVRTGGTQSPFYGMWEEIIRNQRPHQYNSWRGFYENPFNEPRERKQPIDEYICTICTQIFKVPAGASVPDDCTCPKCADKLKWTKSYKTQERQFKCKGCGVEVITKFDGPDDTFVCFICRIKK